MQVLHQSNYLRRHFYRLPPPGQMVCSPNAFTRIFISIYDFSMPAATPCTAATSPISACLDLANDFELPLANAAYRMRTYHRHGANDRRAYEGMTEYGGHSPALSLMTLLALAFTVEQPGARWCPRHATQSPAIKIDAGFDCRPHASLPVGNKIHFSKCRAAFSAVAYLYCRLLKNIV